MPASKLSTTTACFALGSMLLLSCTGNPVGDSEISNPSLQISGQVQLESGLNRGGVFVWLDGFEIGARTDNDGNFQITLPPTSVQSAAGGVDGAFNLYYYLANFRLVTTQVFTKNGRLIVPNGELDDQGSLRQAKFLARFLKIVTIVQPASFEANIGADLHLQVVLQAVRPQDSIRVFYPKRLNGFDNPLLFRNLETGEVTMLEASTSDTVNTDFMIVSSTPTIRELFLNLKSGRLSAGRYEVVPYMLVRHEAVPSGLIADLGDEVEVLGPNYLLVPFRREGGAIEVR